ncbi:MAG: cytochrome [Panacagrimonas sp.]|jgi:cytochrome P450|nr:cytochrome P450 [Panacagrimonas sp.]MCC2659159.1 cytochrome [Panacagrimonas sp.]MDF2466888.1 cytochrome [Ramlibacter sp.]
MTTRPAEDWDPFASDHDPVASSDDMRHRCPVAHGEALGWSLFRHRDVMRAITDHATFSNAVSVHRSVPNGMDPPEHAEYRRVIEPYFSPERIRALQPRCRAVVRQLVASIGDEFEVMSHLAEEFALRVQCEFLDWPIELHAPLRDWVRKNHAAIRSRDRASISAVANEFDAHIRAVLAERRRTPGARPEDVASRLLTEQVRGRNLTDEEIVSILRNWTVGELGTIAASIGILLVYLATHRDLQLLLRESPEVLPAAIDEILRIDAPLLASRRVTTLAVDHDGLALPAGARVTLMWASANRDEEVFGDSDEFRLDRDPRLNLLYGAGIHVCPGAPLARMELLCFLQEFLPVMSGLELVPDKAPVRAAYPAGGYVSAWMRRCG